MMHTLNCLSERTHRQSHVIRHFSQTICDYLDCITSVYAGSFFQLKFLLGNLHGIGITVMVGVVDAANDAGNRHVCGYFSIAIHCTSYGAFPSDRGFTCGLFCVQKAFIIQLLATLVIFL